MKLTKEGFEEIMADAISETMKTAQEEGHASAALGLMLAGIHVGNIIKDKIFESDSEITIIKEGSES